MINDMAESLIGLCKTELIYHEARGPWRTVETSPVSARSASGSDQRDGRRRGGCSRHRLCVGRAGDAGVGALVEPPEAPRAPRLRGKERGLTTPAMAASGH